MANAKIISFVDHEINAALEPVLDDVEAQRVDIVRHIAILTDRIRDTRLDITNAIADNTLTLRRDINSLDEISRMVRQELHAAVLAINALRTDVNAMSAVQTHQRDAIKKLCVDVDQLKTPSNPNTPNMPGHRIVSDNPPDGPQGRGNPP